MRGLDGQTVIVTGGGGGIGGAACRRLAAEGARVAVCDIDGAAAVGMHAVPFTDATTLRADLRRFGLLE